MKTLSCVEISKSKNIKNAVGFVLGHNKSINAMSITLSTMMFRWNVRLLSVSALISVNVIIRIRKQRICLCSDVVAYFFVFAWKCCQPKAILQHSGKGCYAQA